MLCAMLGAMTLNANAQVYAYDTWAQLPTTDLYDTQNMNMALVPKVRAMEIVVPSILVKSFPPGA